MEETQKLPKLTKKQRGFVNDYVKTGVGSIAAKENYNVVTDETARAIAHENLTKPHIVKAIAERLPDDLLEQRHLELLNKRETHTWYEDIKDEKGKVIDIKPHIIDLGVEANAVAKGLDMAYKIKGAYGDSEKPKEKGTNVYNFFFSKEIQEKVGKLESDIKERLKQKHVQND